MWVGRDHRVVTPHGLNARIVAGGIGDGAVAHHVVGDDDRPGARESKGEGEVLRIAGLVGVDEDEVERFVPIVDQAPHRIAGRADAEVDLVEQAGAIDVGAGDRGVAGLNSRVTRRPPSGSARASQIVL